MDQISELSLTKKNNGGFLLSVTDQHWEPGARIHKMS